MEEIKAEGGPEDTPRATAVEAINMKLQPEIVAGRCFEKSAV